MAQTPNDDEAAAISAAIQCFIAETATAPGGGQEEATGPWQRAALLEGVSAKSTVVDSGGERWLS
jgi:hypothetical protein